MDDSPKKLKSNIKNSVIVLVVMLTIVGTWFCSTALGAAAADVNDPNAPPTVTAPTNPEVMKYGLIAAAVAFGLGAIGAGFAISHVGAAAMGAVAEKPEIAGQALIFVALAEGIVVFGFITALMILGKV
jgi:V/A-type H+/Na+-transporting ATPase subunit K